MAIKMNLELPVHPEKRDELIQMLRGALPDTVAFDGCHGVDVLTPDDDPSTIVCAELWDSREHQAAYFKWRVETGLIDALGPFLRAEPKAIWFTEHEWR